MIHQPLNASGAKIAHRARFPPIADIQRLPGAAAPHRRLAVNPPIARRVMPYSPIPSTLFKERPARQSRRRAVERGRDGLIAQQIESTSVGRPSTLASQISDVVIEGAFLLAACLVPFRRARIAVVKEHAGGKVPPDRNVKAPRERFDRRERGSATRQNGSNTGTAPDLNLAHPNKAPRSESGVNVGSTHCMR